MMHAGRGVSSVRQVSAWLIVAAGLGLYGALFFVLGIARVSPSLPLPWWAALVVPPIVYGIVVRLAIRRLSIVRWMAATLSLWAIHVLLGALTAGGVLPVGFAPVDVVPPPALLGMLWVPLFLVPFRDVIRGRPLPPPGRRPPGRRVDGPHREGAPLPAGQHAASSNARPGTLPQPRTPAPPPSAERPRNEGPWARQTGSASPSSPGQRGPVEKGEVSKAATNGDAPAGAAAGPPPPRSYEPADGASPVLVRVSFDRVAGQLPPGAFRVPLEEIGPILQEPGHLLIPQPLVLAQLAEGLVRAGWEVVAGQFPRDALSMTDEEIRLRLVDGQLVLPLDELVPQLPRDFFTPSGRAVDVESIASVPPPFRPVAAEPAGEGRAAVRPSDVPSMTAPRAVTLPGSAIDPSCRDGRSAEEPASGVAVLEDVEPAPALMGAAGVEPGSRPALDTRCDPPHVGWPRPGREDGAAASSPTSNAVRRASGVPDRDVAATMDRIAAAFSPLCPLEVGVETVDRVTLFTVSGLDRGAARGAAGVLLPLLAEGRAPWPVSQLTTWGADTVLILTPLGPVDKGGAVLVSAVPPGGMVASVERLCLRAMAGETSNPVQAPRADPDHSGAGQEPALIDAEPPARVHRIAASLSAFGPVTARVLSDTDAARDLYLFLPEGSDTRLAGRFARELDRAARRLAGPDLTFRTAVLRCGGRRLIIRLDCTAGGHAAIVVAGGPTDRAGLASRQVEAAASLLSAR